MWNPEDLWRHENPIFWITKRIYTEEEKKREFLISLTAAIKVSKAVTISTSLEKINTSFIILIIIIN